MLLVASTTIIQVLNTLTYKQIHVCKMTGLNKVHTCGLYSE